MKQALTRPLVPAPQVNTSPASDANIVWYPPAARCTVRDSPRSRHGPCTMRGSTQSPSSSAACHAEAVPSGRTPYISP
eukprot:7363680-Pyramimonas_sp.AAC.1